MHWAGATALHCNESKCKLEFSFDEYPAYLIAIGSRGQDASSSWHDAKGEREGDRRTERGGNGWLRPHISVGLSWCASVAVLILHTFYCCSMHCSRPDLPSRQPASLPTMQQQGLEHACKMNLSLSRLLMMAYDQFAKGICAYCLVSMLSMIRLL